MVDYSLFTPQAGGGNSAAPQQSIRDIANLILANSEFGPSQSELKAAKKAAAAAKSKHEGGGMQRVWDFLNMPTYTLANAADEALAGHQQSDTDNFLSDFGKTVGGIGTGAARGLGASLRGTFSGLIPGLGSDETAADTTDKTHASDVMNRFYLHMPTSEAMKPENYKKVQERVGKMKINQLGSDTDPANLFFHTGEPATDEQVQSYFKTVGLSGIASDIIGDPLNFVNPVGLAGKLREGKQLEEAVKGGTTVASDLAKDIPIGHGGLKEPDLAKLVAATKSAPIGEVAPLTNLAPKGKHLIEHPKGYKAPLAAQRPKAGFAVSPIKQEAAAKKIIDTVARGEKGWVYKAANELERIAPGRDFPATSEFLQRVQTISKAKGHPAHVTARAMAADLKRHIADDVAAMSAMVKPAKAIVNDGPMADIVLGQMAKPLKKLKPAQAGIAADVIQKYAPRILGKVAPTTERSKGAINKAIAEGRNVRYSGPQQVNTYQTILGKLTYKSPAKFTHATDILRKIEDYFQAKGAIAHSSFKAADSTPLRLSDVLRAIGPEAANMSPHLLTRILRSDPAAMAELPAETVQRIEAIKAGESLATAPTVKAGLDSAMKQGEEIKSAPLSLPRQIDSLQNIIRNTKASIITAGGGESGAHIAGRVLKQNFNLAGPVSRVYKSGSTDTLAFLATASKDSSKFTPVDPKSLQRISKAIAQAIESPPVRELGKIIGPAARVVDWFGARFNAAYGVEDMRPIFLAQQASALSSAARRSAFLNQLGRDFPVADKDLWSNAFKSAQGNLPPVGGDVDDLAMELQRTMESLFGGSGLREGAISEATVIARSRLLMNDLNRNMERFGLRGLKFTDGKDVKDAMGISQNYSKSADWVKSWEAFKVTDPYKFMHQIQASVEYTVREKMMFDEIASRFGVFKKSGEYKYGVNHPRLKGVYFTDEGARQATQFIKQLKEMSQQSSKTLQHIQHVTSKFKAAVTIYWPSHHVNNLIGDTAMNWYAGVNSVTPYTLAMKVMKSQRGRYKDIEDVSQLTGPNALLEALGRREMAAIAPTGAKGDAVIFKMRNGENVTADMIATAAQNTGIMPIGRVLEDVSSDVTNVLDRIGLPGKYHGAGQRRVHAWSETRDHWPRYAQFIDHLSKATTSFEDAIKPAAAAVRKWHPDGLDLTQFERNTMKTVLPFYSWMRKAIPLSIETALTVPGKVKAYPQLIEALQINAGINSEHSYDQPFPTDQLFTDWMRDKGVGPISGGPGNYTIVNPSIPANDVLSSLFTPSKTIEGYISPLAKVPLETLMGREMTTGAEIGAPGGQTWTDYYAKQTPVISNIGRASGQFGVAPSVKDQGFPNTQNIINMLSGLRVTNTGNYGKSAQFDLRDYLRRQANGG